MSNTQEYFQTISPKNKLLSKHIKYYYFHKSLDINFYKNVVYHPHYVTALNVYKGVQVQLSDNGRIYLPDSSNNLSVIYTINKTKSREVRLRGKFDKIGVIFHPLGINNFINGPLSNVISNSICNFDYFGKDLHEISTRIYNCEKIEDKRDLLDNFFSIRYNILEDSRIITAVEYICNSDGVIKTKDLAKLLNISRETLLRLFKKQLCYSVEEFKSAIKFRNALEYYEETEIKPKLTDVALENQYYDQSAFIKHFKKVTGLSPKNFFSSLSNIGNSGTYWTFKD